MDGNPITSYVDGVEKAERKSHRRNAAREQWTTGLNARDDIGAINMRVPKTGEI